MKTPGEGLARRPLHFIWICDCSGSMAGEKIQSLNHAIKEALPHMKEVAKTNPNAEVLVRAIKFAETANWHHANATKVEDFKWIDITAGAGRTSMGAAMRLLAEQMAMPPMEERGLPPVLVLVSDGQPTDDFNGGLAELMTEGWGKKAARIAIAIGSDADLGPLQDFIGNSEIKPLEAKNSEALINYIRWASTAVLKAASQPASTTGKPGAAANNVPIPAPPDPGPSSADDVW